MDEEIKPKLFSLAWFRTLGEAFKFKKYGPKEWGIWCLSSIFSDLKYVIGGVLFYLWGLLPVAVSNVIKSIAFKVAAVCVATVEIIAAS